MNNFLTKKTIYLILIICTVVAAVCKIFIGLDIDESYTVFLSYKLSKGAKPLKQVWDIYQTNSLIVMPLIALRNSLTPSADGLIIFVRIISVVFQGLISFLCYLIMRCHFQKSTAIFSALVMANMLPRATQSLEYGFVTVELILLCCLILFDIAKGNRKYVYVKIICAAIAYGLAVLDYPTMIIIFPILIYSIMKDKSDESRNIKSVMIFTGTCFLLLVALATMLLSYMNFDEIVFSIRGILMTGDHSSFFSFIRSPQKVWISLIRCVALAGITICIYLFFRKRISADTIPYLYMPVMATIVMVPNILGIRLSGPFGLLERYILFVAFSIFFFSKKNIDKDIVRLFILTGLGCYVAALMGSNLGLNENAMYLEPAIIGCVVCACEALKTEQSTNIKNMKYLFLSIFVFEIIFSKGYFVRVDGTAPANILEKRVEMSGGVMRGINIYAEDKEKKEKKIDYIVNSTQVGNTYTYIGRDSLMNFYFQGETIAPQYVPTFTLGEQWVIYFDREDVEIPGYIYVDRENYQTVEDFYKTEFGQFVENKYKIIDANDQFNVLKKII